MIMGTTKPCSMRMVKFKDCCVIRYCTCDRESLSNSGWYARENQLHIRQYNGR